MVSLGDSFFLLQRTWNIFIQHLPEPTGPAKFSTHCGRNRLLMCCLALQAIPLLIVDGLQTFDMLPSSTGNSSTHRGRTTDF
ncbi:hypothetical protein TNCV_2637081 [Trichonephila clavipes]|uniref:Uncharacterized protein n=1 Tax=Trichonephila clavipes TaxID=2585209 RepID=A0A8X6R294_TRICX|nr:hypothetical protein TNCV_2637081 [Trichonephila clavipes]